MDHLKNLKCDRNSFSEAVEKAASSLLVRNIKGTVTLENHLVISHYLEIPLLSINSRDLDMTVLRNDSHNRPQVETTEK